MPELENIRVSLLASQSAALCGYFESDPQGHERAAIVLFRRLGADIDGLSRSDRFLLINVIPFEPDWVSSSSPAHIAFRLEPLRQFFQECQEEGLVFGFAHNHPGNYPDFSEVDDLNEATLVKALTNRNGKDLHFVALLWTGGKWKARVQTGYGQSLPVRHVTVVGNGLELYGYTESKSEGDDFSSRQAAAFGQPFVDRLRSLRVAVIGAGGTGSAVIALLARCGIGEIIAVDHDVLEKSNLNRVRGAGLAHVGDHKVDIAKAFLETYTELPTRMAVFRTILDEDPTTIDAVLTADLIFGCTDDQPARGALSAIVPMYNIPLIDLGLGGNVSEDADGIAILSHHFGRISTIMPERGECLFCQGIISNDGIRSELAFRKNPEMTEEQARGEYLQNAGTQAPGVGPFTGIVADYGVATLFDLIRRYRRIDSECLRQDMVLHDFCALRIYGKAEKNDIGCPYCRTGDYILKRSKHRLNRPALGRLNALP